MADKASTTSSTDAATEPLKRHYALSPLGKGSGQYLLYSNDVRFAFVIARYVESPGQLYDSAGREISGTFWRTLFITPKPAAEAGWLIYDREPGFSEIIGGARNLDDLSRAATNLDDRLVVWAELLSTRNEAAQEALRRYKASEHRKGQGTWPEGTWGVRDRALGGWPTISGGRVITSAGSRADAELDADWMNRSIG